ncbi:LysE family translocator [Streptomyces sp. MP131-18]|uniref:LysE family translocator n=1 Tax=Streptomyces sp. MP131-18 TaxID=1857892 RepID=UPI00097C41FC|nr:LysE family translocator [Streptomyces sp. MP131-18]ONK12867.1 Leucine efflux protein [Streptomyces sp. MP131-18]
MDSLLLFLGVDLLLVCTPGPDWLYVIARGLGQGRRAALTAVAGVCAGYLVYTVAVTAGLAAAVRAYPAVLPVLRYAGAAYLTLLAVRMLLAARRGARAAAPEPAAPLNTAAVARQSMLTALLNPKALLLFVSLLPQFTDTGAALPVGAQLALLGALHILLCGLVYSAVGLTAARVGGAVRSPGRGLTRISAGLLLVVAAVTAAP